MDVPERRAPDSALVDTVCEVACCRRRTTNDDSGFAHAKPRCSEVHNRRMEARRCHLGREPVSGHAVEGTAHIGQVLQRRNACAWGNAIQSLVGDAPPRTAVTLCVMLELLAHVLDVGGVVPTDDVAGGTRGVCECWRPLEEFFHLQRRASTVGDPWV